MAAISKGKSLIPIAATKRVGLIQALGPLPMHLSAAKRLLIGLALSWSFSSLASSIQATEFKAKSLKIHPGMDELEVVRLLGKPEKIFVRPDSIVIGLKAQRGLVYWRPESATVFLAVGISRGKVTAVDMCQAVGSRAWTTQCQEPSVYWQKSE